MPNPGISHMFHVNVIVRDIERSVAWYSEVLGARVIEAPAEASGIDLQGINFGLESQGVDPKDIKIRFALVGWGDGPRETLLDIIESVNPLPFGEVEPSVLGLGIARICFDTVSVDAAYEALSKQGVEFLTPIIDERHHGGICYVCFRDPDGIVLELRGPR